MAKAVTIVEAGGFPVTNTESLLAGTPMTPVDAGGMAVTLVDSGGYPVVLINEDGTLWESETLLEQASAIVLAANGALYDPSDLTSLYQSRTGGDTGASGSVVGIMLDKSYMGGQTAAAFIAGQAELMPDGDFASGSVAAWSRGANSVDGTLTIVGGRLRSTVGAGDTSGSPFWTRPITGLTVGRRYRVVFGVRSGTATNIWLGFSAVANGTTADTITTNGGVGIFQATATTMYAAAIILSATAGQYGEWDDLSVKEIPGFHALAPSDAARPVLTVSGGLAYLTADGVDDWMQVLPTLNLGEQWWHVGGWRSDTNGRFAFALSSLALGAMQDGTTKWDWPNSAGAQTTIANGDPKVAAVVTVQQSSTSEISGRYNGGADTNFTPYDDSAGTQGLGLFSQYNNGVVAALAGRFYGGAFAPGALTAGDRTILEQLMAEKAGVTLA